MKVFNQPESLPYVLKYLRFVSLKARSLPVRPVHFQSILHLPTMHKAVLQHGSTSFSMQMCTMKSLYCTFTLRTLKSGQKWKSHKKHGKTESTNLVNDVR